MKKNNENHINDWENPRVFEKNQTKPHTTLVPFNTEKKALNSKGSSSDNYFSLNGKWKFNWSQNPELAPEGFYKLNYSYNNWDEIKVPSNWQMEGYGYPLFRNVSHTFPSDPPEVPSDFNPVGSYVKIFELPENWDNRKIFLHFEGVKSASYVWINGEEVGYNQGGMEPAEYDITDYLKSGKNKIAVKVLRYSDGTYLECQDMWRLSGIYRDVYLMSTPQVHIRDFYVTTDLDSSYKDANLKVEAKIKNYKKDRIKNYQFILQLYDEEDKEVFSRSVSKNIETVASGEEKEITVLQKVKNPDKWSAEFPHLYTLTLKLQDENKNTLEVLKNKTGFRQIEIKNQAVYVNGVPVKLNGVNSHMQHPETGRTVDKETMKKDLILMKKFNVNCVRTCHYPPNKEYLELADELGIYIIDEVGDEAHANFHLSEDPDWKGQYLDRMRKMVYRDRNHPSIIFWSAGNESGWGENICALIAEGKKIDPSRPGWMYGGNNDNVPAENPIDCEDIVGPRYARPFRLENLFGRVPEDKDPRPSFMDEYLSAAGNSLGGLDEYWDLIWKYPRLTGGAIWDWISPGIKEEVVFTEDKSPYNHICSLMGRAQLQDTDSGKVLSLSGHDEWLEVYRDKSLDLEGDQLSISLWVYPESREDCSVITKGNYQFGVEQRQNKLIFYLGGKNRVTLKADLPAHWEKKWHHIAGIYDGETINLYLDGKQVSTRSWQQKLKNTPFPINIGKNAETQGQDHPGKLFAGKIDQVRIIDKAIPADKLYSDKDISPEKALLWLDFERSDNKGYFYSLGIGARSYGLVWPDRRVKPELWQLKKSAQPVSIIPVNLEQGKFKITNRHHFKNLNDLKGNWKLSANGVNGEVLEKGELDIDLEAGKKKIIKIPYKIPDNDKKDYYFLVKFALKNDTLWAKSGHEIAWEQFEVTSAQSEQFMENSSVNDITELSLKQDNAIVHIQGDNFSCNFDKTSGFLTSLKYREQELIKQGPKFNVWRAPVANELDEWPMYRTETAYLQKEMGNNIAGGWRSIGLNKLTHELVQFSVKENDETIEIAAEYMVSGNNYISGFKTGYHYIVNSGGKITLNLKVIPYGNMTGWLPKIGTIMKLPRELQQIKWYGKGPFENYPDRKTGAKTGIFESKVKEEYQPYLIPQDYGNKTEVKWFTISSKKGNGLLVTSKEKLNISSHQYELYNLSRANYPFQLKKSDSVILNIDHNVSGVGGTSISVQDKYKILPQKDEYTFSIIPGNFNK